MTTMEKIEGFLKEMNLVYSVVPAKDQIVLPYTIKDKRFYVVIDRSDKWVRFHTIILEYNQIDKIDKLPLHKMLLEANGNLAEVKYYMTEKGDVGVIGHEGVDVLTLEAFQQEYKAIPFAISYFIEQIASKLKIEVPGFE